MNFINSSRILMKLIAHKYENKQIYTYIFTYNT